MPNALILGGSGYLGFAITKSLLSAGTYTVWGTARTSEKAKLLLRNEVQPIQDDITDPVKLAALVAEHSIDVVVDSTSAYEQAGQILQGIVDAATSRRDTLKKEGIVGPKLGYVYSSGLWVHGSPSSRVSDLSPVGSTQSQDKPATPVAWRPAHEQRILASRGVLDVAILRPGATYGRSSWVLDTWWGSLLAAKKSSNEETIQVPADIAARTAMVHVDDVAATFHAAINRLDGRLGAWPVFDLVTETIGVQEIMEATKNALGIKAKLEYIGTNGNPFLEALSLVNRSDASRARTVLRWEGVYFEPTSLREIMGGFSIESSSKSTFSIKAFNEATSITVS